MLARKDNRDPVAMGECLLWCGSLYPTKSLSHIADVARPLDDVPNYDANPSCIEKYGRPQDLPPTPF